LSAAVDTAGSQAHGSRSYEAIGLVLQRALALSLAACVPLLALYGAAGPVLRALGQQAELAGAAARYVRIFAPVVPLHAANSCLYRTLACQGGLGGLGLEDGCVSGC
jgi:MATE family multidrug resistance protein